MKASFPEYYRPTETEFHALWAGCLFAVDANVLLNVYGYSIETREALISLFENIAPRLRMPYQFALEYQRNRNRAIMEQVKNYLNVENTLNNVYLQELEPKQKHPFLSKKNLSAFRKIQAELSEARKKHEVLLSADPYAERIAKAVMTVGAKPLDHAAIHEKARLRYASKIPPGFADVKEKTEPDCFGDCVGWLQILAIGKAEKKPMILITDDSKEDWWQIQSGRTIGPRPELVAEYLSECGQPFYMYSSGRFMDLASQYLNQSVEKKAIEEVKLRFAEQLRDLLKAHLKEVPGSVILRPDFAFKQVAEPLAEKSDELKSHAPNVASVEKSSTPEEPKGGSQQT